MSSGETGTRTEGGGTAANGRSGTPRLEVTGTQVCASTLASVSGAAAASVFGVAGTIAGTATMSVVATVGGAVYSFWLRRTHARLQDAPIATRVVDLLSSTAGGRVRPRVEGDRTAEGSDVAGTVASSPTETTEPEAATAATDADVTADMEAGGEVSDEGPGGQESGPWAWVARRHWGVVAGVAVVFAVSLGLVTLVELIGQRPLADIAGGESSGGTSIGKVVDSDDQADAPDDGSITTTSPPQTTTDPSGTVTTEEDSSASETTSQDSESTSSTSTTVGSSPTSTTTGSTTSTTVATPSTTATTSTPP